MSVKLESYGAPASVKEGKWNDDQKEALRPESAPGARNGDCGPVQDEPSAAEGDASGCLSAKGKRPAALELKQETHYNPAQSPAGGDMSRKDLLSRIADKDASAFEEFYQMYQQPLFGYLMTLLRNRQQAEDVFQEVMKVVWEKPSGCRNRSNPSGWLFGIARNKAYTCLKRSLPAGGSDPEVNLPDPSQEFEMSIISRESLEKALPKLSAEQWDVIELFHFGDLSYKEISQAIGCPIGTVKSRLYYAHQKLKKLLKKDWEK